MYSISIFYLTFYLFEGDAYAPNATPAYWPATETLKMA